VTGNGIKLSMLPTVRTVPRSRARKITRERS
jgi:hypothetical protein